LLNPLDRVVAFQSIDVDASFPGGRPDFDNYWRNLESSPQAFVTNSVLHQQRVVNANRFFEKFDVVGNYIYYFSSFVDSLFTPYPNSSVALPPENGLYVVHGVGMGLYSPEAHNFVSTQMTNEYVADVILNVGDGALGRLLFLSDPKTLLSNAVQSAMAKIYNHVAGVVAAQPVQTPKDFILDTLTATKEMLIDFAKDKVKDAANGMLEVANEGAAETLNTLGNVANALSSFSTYGSMAERVAGLYDSSALETSFLLVGDPFSFTNVTVNPNPFGPGETITVSFQGSPKLQSFDTNNPQNFVRFVGPNFYFGGQVTSVSGPDADGVQTLTVRIPISVGTTHDGVYTMIAQTQGRTATTFVRLATPITIQSVTPLQGFVPVANFNGSPYPGTAVRLQGTLFTWTDTYLFAGNGANGVASTNVQPNNFQGGDVTVYVPPGAITGPLQILHNAPGGVLRITGPLFTVITAPPTITAVQPANAAPIGDLLRLTVNQVGTDPNSIYYQFPGSPPQHPHVLADGSLLAYIVYGTQTGNGTLAVFTPPGSNSVPFDVLAALTRPISRTVRRSR
jgi:hypothetical protein